MSGGELFTTKQFGDACEMLVAANLTLAGIPATLMPDSWPDYDLIAQRLRRQQPLRISVKARSRSPRSQATHTYHFPAEGWDWIAFVFQEHGGPPQFWLLPADAAVRASSPDGEGRRLPHKRLVEQLGAWKDNFSLRPDLEGSA